MLWKKIPLCQTLARVWSGADADHEKVSHLYKTFRGYSWLTKRAYNRTFTSKYWLQTKSAPTAKRTLHDLIYTYIKYRHTHTYPNVLASANPCQRRKKKQNIYRRMLWRLYRDAFSVICALSHTQEQVKLQKVNVFCCSSFLPPQRWRTRCARKLWRKFGATGRSELHIHILPSRTPLFWIIIRLWWCITYEANWLT